MTFSTRLQLLTCLVLYASCAHAIMVKFGTKGGPIEPPPPEPPLPVPVPGRIPAPVWEERANDAPDPNVHWRPQPFVPQPRYTHIVYNFPPSTQKPITNAQRFVNEYVPQHQPVQAQPITNYFTPSQILSSQNLPGFGIRYFVPAYLSDLQNRKEQFRQEDAKYNQIETNDISGSSRESAHDAQWKYEKDSTKRITRAPQTSNEHVRRARWEGSGPQRMYMAVGDHYPTPAPRSPRTIALSRRVRWTTIYPYPYQFPVYVARQ